MEVYAMLNQKARMGRSNLMLCFIAAMCLSNLTDAVAQEPPPIEWYGDDSRGGITTSGYQVQYSGDPTGWSSNFVGTRPLSTIGLYDDYEVSFSIDSDPANSLWMAGLDRSFVSPWWRDMDHALRNSNGRLTIYERGTWRTSGPQLSQGDVVSIYVNSGVIEYRHNGNAVYVSTYSGSRDFTVSATFKRGAATIEMSLPPGGELPPARSTPITAWLPAIGGVTTSIDAISYSGSPTGWVNSVNSMPLSTLGVGNDYEVSWTVDSDPGNGIWVIGLGVAETRSNWRDVDFAFRNSNGFLTVHESGVFVQDVGALKVGDVLSLHVVDSQLNYDLNGVTVYSRTILGSEDFYIDTAFKNGQARLASFTLDAWDEPPPPASTPIMNWLNTTGGVTTSANNVSYSGTPTGWANSVNSIRLSTLGAGDLYEVSWTIISNPSNSLWVVGLASSESSNSWRDFNVAFRNSRGKLQVYVNGIYHSTMADLSVGDVVVLRVFGQCVQFGHNGLRNFSGCNFGIDADNIYIDTAFKYGATDFGNFVLTRY